MRIIFNAIFMALELAAIAGVAWLGLHSPLLFAAVTASLALALGIGLEIARLKNEMPFYFDRPPSSPTGKLNMFTVLVGSTEAIVKALGTGFGEHASWLDFEIINDAAGKPCVHFSSKLQERMHNTVMHISISHCKLYVIATAIWSYRGSCNT